MKKELINRDTLIQLIQEGMEYPEGKHRFWVARCYEITVRDDKTVELDEYESVSTELAVNKEVVRFNRRSQDKEMFHVGRSIVNPEKDNVIEKIGQGWGIKRS